MTYQVGTLERARLMFVRADLVVKWTRVADRFTAETGEKVYVISGWRSLGEQSGTYADSLAQGFRAAPPEKSRHPLGAAIDVGIVGRVRDADTDQADPLYRRLAEIAQEEGLVAGFYFTGKLHDPYHLELDETLEQSRAKWAALKRGWLWRLAGAAIAALMLWLAWRAVHRSRRKDP